MFWKYGAIASLRYDQFEAIYHSLFEGRIHILLFEEFVQHRAVFVEKLSEILKIDRNESLQLLKDSHERRRITDRMRKYNRFRTSFLWGVNLADRLPFGKCLARNFETFLAKGVPAQIQVDRSIERTIHALYSEGNSKLALKYDLPLQKYGYPLTD